MSRHSDRRWFLKLLPQAAAGVAAASVVGTPMIKVMEPPIDLNKPLTEEEMIAICNAAVICFGLKPRGDD